MSVSNQNIITLRKERGWSQEKLAAISGLSERTIQRIERDGNCSLDSKMALASAFEIAPQELSAAYENESEKLEMIIDWGGALGLLILGLATPAVILLTGTDGKWELASFSIVIGLTVILSIMTYGFKKTHELFDKTSYIVKYPKKTIGLNQLIVQAQFVIRNAYIIGVLATLVTGLTLAIHKPEMLDSLKYYLPITFKPSIYAMLFIEFWFRPYKNKLEKMLTMQTAESL
jgi:transcriptional regulator with XRE-family HTH domain